MNTIVLNNSETLIDWLNPERDKAGWYRIIAHGDIYTLLNGKLESLNGEPSVINKTGIKKWHKNGILNRINDPAIEDGNIREFWIDGWKMTEVDYCKKLVADNLANEEYRRKCLLLAL